MPAPKQLSKGARKRMRQLFAEEGREFLRADAAARKALAAGEKVLVSKDAWDWESPIPIVVGVNQPIENWESTLHAAEVEQPIEKWEIVEVVKTEAEFIKERIERENEGWPWNGTPEKLLTVGPYLFNHNYKNPKALPRVAQKSGLFIKLFEDPIILRIITRMLFEHHDSASKFTSTCQLAWDVMTWDLCLFDVNGGWYNNCDNGPPPPPDYTLSEDEKKKRLQDLAQGTLVPYGSVGQVVLIAPFRSEEPVPKYGEQITHLHSMCTAVNNFADYFRIIHFHRIPFLTTDIFTLLIPKMRNLRSVGIYKCQLIHVGETNRLLEIIRTDRPLERENQVKLDFFPNYHRGPSAVPNTNKGRDFQGSYGVTWDNANMNSSLAIWAIVSKVIPQARKQGIDFESPHTMFRQWLEKSPCWRVEKTLKALIDPDIKPEVLAAMVDASNPDHFGNVKKFTGVVPNRPHGWKWAVQKIPCYACESKLLGIFFFYPHIRDCLDHNDELIPELESKCLGCLLTDYLDSETDHYKTQKRTIVAHWLRDPLPLKYTNRPAYAAWTKQPDEPWNEANLPKALSDFNKRNILKSAEKLQRVREKDKERKRYDGETEEIQRQMTEQERNLKYGRWKRAPEVWEKETWDPEGWVGDGEIEGKKRWGFWRCERRFAHGY